MFTSKRSTRGTTGRAIAAVAAALAVLTASVGCDEESVYGGSFSDDAALYGYDTGYDTGYTPEYTGADVLSTYLGNFIEY